MSKEGTKKTKKTTKKKVVKKTTKKVVKKKKITPKEKKVKTLKKTASPIKKEREDSPVLVETTTDKIKDRSFDYSKYESKNSANIWLWGGITIILIFMVVVWFMTTKLQIENYDKLQGDDSGLIQKTQENWDNAFAKTQEKENVKQTIKEQIKNILKEFNDVVSETASTTTSTDQTTSTLEFTTSTPLEFSTSSENLTGQVTTTLTE